MKLEIVILGEKKIPDSCQPKHHNTFSLNLIFSKINITTIFHLVLSPPARKPRQGFVDSSVGQSSSSPSVSGYDLWGRWPEKVGVSEPSSGHHHSSAGMVLPRGTAFIIPIQSAEENEWRDWSVQRAHFFPPVSFLLLSWHELGSRSFICHSSQEQRQKSSEWSHHSSISVTITPVTHRLHDSFRLKTSSELRL